MVAHAPKDIIPLYVKEGSILPVGPNVQYSTEKKWDHIEIRIYPGANGTFTIYEDENDNYNYEKGVYTTIDLSWNEEVRTLTIAERKGSFPNMLKQRKFNVVMMTPGKSPDESGKADKVISYTGKRVSVRL